MLSLCQAGQPGEDLAKKWTVYKRRKPCNDRLGKELNLLASRKTGGIQGALEECHLILFVGKHGTTLERMLMSLFVLKRYQF